MEKFMWTRAELKRSAKQTMSRSYWKCVLASLILAVATGVVRIGGVSIAASTVAGWVSEGFSQLTGTPEVSVDLMSSALGSFVVIGLLLFAFVRFVISILEIVIQIFLLHPLEVGGQSFYINNRAGDDSLKTLGKGFAVNYLNVVKTMFLRQLFTALWTILFIIPGIIKSYEYRMIPYILAENPKMDSREAFRLSREMMKGQKWRSFVLDLSFLGWQILSCFTLGILNVFYVAPYKDNTNVELYSVLKDGTFGGGQGMQGQAAASWEAAGNFETSDTAASANVYGGSEEGNTDSSAENDGVQ